MTPKLLHLWRVSKDGEEKEEGKQGDFTAAFLLTSKGMIPGAWVQWMEKKTKKKKGTKG